MAENIAKIDEKIRELKRKKKTAENLKAHQYRKIVEKYASESFLYTDGLELLNYPPYISQDLVHPSTEGIAEIVSEWLCVMKEYVS